jgi:hypothetical protein
MKSLSLLSVLLATLSASATPLPGDPASQALQQLGEPRASVALPSEVTVLAFDRGDVWVRKGIIIKTELVSEAIAAERRKAEQQSRTLREREQKEAARRAEEVQSLRKEQEGRQAELIEQVRREVRYPVHPPSLMAGFVAVRDFSGTTGALALRFSAPRDHAREPSGKVTALYLEVVGPMQEQIPSGTLVATFLDSKGAVLDSSQLALAPLAPGEVRMLALRLGRSARSPGIGDGSSVDEVRFDFFAADLSVRYVDKPRWLRP